MSISLYSEDGFVSDIASNAGYARTLLFLKNVSGANQLKHFLKEGKTEHPKEVLEDLNFVLDESATKIQVSVSSVLINLRDGMRSVKEVGIIE